jgi:hypothetical protein
MDFDYGKVVNFMLGVNSKQMVDALSTIISGNFNMIDVNGDIKKILLNSIKTNDNYVLLTRNGLVILPINSNVKYLTEEFIRIIEITINSDDNLVISEISSNNNGLVAFSSTWSFYNNVYDQLNGYIVFFDRNDISSMDSLTIEMFLNQYYSKRSGVFNDLYWDIISYSRDTFVNSKINRREQVTETSSDFSLVYNKWIEIVNRCSKN